MMIKENKPMKFSLEKLPKAIPDSGDSSFDYFAKDPSNSDPDPNSAKRICVSHTLNHNEMIENESDLNDEDFKVLKRIEKSKKQNLSKQTSNIIM